MTDALLLYSCFEFIFCVFLLELFEITADPCVKCGFLHRHCLVSFCGVLVYFGPVVIDEVQLINEQLPIRFVRLLQNIELYQILLLRRYHVVEAKQSVFSSVKPHDMYRIAHLLVVWLGRFHRYKIPVTVHVKNDPDIWPPLVFVILHSVVNSMHKTYISVMHAKNSKSLFVVHLIPLTKRRQPQLPPFRF